jgi:hypothetical protein
MTAIPIPKRKKKEEQEEILFQRRNFSIAASLVRIEKKPFCSTLWNEGRTMLQPGEDITMSERERQREREGKRKHGHEFIPETHLYV